MKIGFDAKRAFLNPSGLGNYSRNLLNALHQYSPEIQSVLFSPEVNGSLFENHHLFETHAPASGLSTILKPFWRSFGTTRLQKQQIEIFHGLSNELPYGIHHSKIASVVTIHDLIFIRFPEFYSFIDRTIYARKVKYACRLAKKIIAISNQTKEDLVNFLHVPPAKIEVIYQPVSQVFFEANTDNNLLEKYGLNEKYFLVVGTIEPRKNQLSILKAIQMAELNATLVFVGRSTAYKKQLRNFITANKLTAKVVFLENLPEMELAGLYRQATCSVYLSLFEGFGLPVIESMASGCPVITSNVSCMPETAGGAALLCSPDDTNTLAVYLKQLSSDEIEREKWIEKGKERAKLFHSERFAVKMKEFYKSLIET